MSTYRDAIEYLTARAALSNKHESDLSQVNHASRIIHETFTEFEDIRFESGQILEKSKTLSELCETLRNGNEKSIVWVVERNFKTPKMKSDDWQYFTFPQGFWSDYTEATENPYFTPVWDRSLKFFDRASCELVCADTPDEWDIRITEHQIL